METSEVARRQRLIKEMHSSDAKTWQIAMIQAAVMEEYLNPEDIDLKVCFYTGGKVQ